MASLNRYVAFEPRDFLRSNVFSDLFAELLDRFVRAVFFKLAQHTGTEPGNTEDILVTRGIEVYRYEPVLGQPRCLRGSDVFSDLLVELSEVPPRTVLSKLVSHLISGPGYKHNLFAGRGVEIDVDENLP